MTIFIIVFITLSIMGSALWILPSKQDKQRMALRMLAMKRHLSVQLTSIELPDKWDKSKEVHKVCAYALHRVHPAREITETVWLLSYDVWKYNEVISGWWCNKNIALTDADKSTLASFGQNVVAIEISQGTVTLYWQEEGDEKTVEDIAELLMSLANNTNII